MKPRQEPNCRLSRPIQAVVALTLLPTQDCMRFEDLRTSDPKNIRYVTITAGISVSNYF